MSIAIVYFNFYGLSLTQKETAVDKTVNFKCSKQSSGISMSRIEGVSIKKVRVNDLSISFLAE